MHHPPQPARPTGVLEWDHGQRRRVLDELATEEPLEIRVDGAPLIITMRTPGEDFALAAGFLFTEGIVRQRDDIVSIRYGRHADGQPSGNVVEVSLRRGSAVDLGSVTRAFPVASSCGICGKASIDAVRARGFEAPSRTFRLDPEVLIQLPDALRPAQKVFGRTGGLHAAALFDGEGIIHLVHEDIGRHNAVDKVVGEALFQGAMPLSNRVLVVSGRGGFEIVQKALPAGLPVVASVSAPSSLAVQLAREYGVTLVGFLRGRRFVVYSGEERLIPNGSASADGSGTERRFGHARLGS
jgi:FdhD protein